MKLECTITAEGTELEIQDLQRELNTKLPQYGNISYNIRVSSHGEMISDSSTHISKTELIIDADYEDVTPSEEIILIPKVG